jgi:hypothetical protein
MKSLKIPKNINLITFQIKNNLKIKIMIWLYVYSYNTINNKSSNI